MGLTLKVIAERVPGDREDEGRTYCEVIGRYTEQPRLLDNEWTDYDIGLRDGWYLVEQYGWEKVG